MKRLSTARGPAIGFGIALSLCFAPLAHSAADWPQWRGPLRNGIAPDSPKLLEKLPADGLKELWESETIPANDEGGLSSPVIAGGLVIVGLVGHRDLPSETRQISELVVRQLGHQNARQLGEELLAKIEKTRETLRPTLRGKKLEEFTDKFDPLLRFAPSAWGIKCTCARSTPRAWSLHWARRRPRCRWGC